MMRDQKTIQQSLINKLSPGFALSKRGGTLDAIYNAVAEPLAENEKGLDDALKEVVPRDAYYLLSDYERVLGPDPCGRDQGAKTLNDRQALAWQRWIARGGQSIAYFLSLARALGYQISIEDYWPSIAGVIRAGHSLIPETEKFVWVVHMKAQNPWRFTTGRNEAGERLGGFDEGDLECMFQRLKPAHTEVVFYYDKGMQNGQN